MTVTLQQITKERKKTVGQRAFSEVCGLSLSHRIKGGTLVELMRKKIKEFIYIRSYNMREREEVLTLI